MTEPTVAATGHPRVDRRVIGQIVGGRPGPTLLVTALIHGNEPAGFRAARRVLLRIEGAAERFGGELLVLAGNLRAAAECRRYVDEDLNRHWTEHGVARLSDSPATSEPAEAGQRRALIEQFRAAVARSRGPIHFIDLHTSSAEGPPFLTVGDTLRNRDFAQRFPLPIMLGLEETIDGSLLEYLNNLGFVTMGVEAGRHDAAESVDRHEAVLWLALTTLGMLSDADAGLLRHSRALLEQASGGLPRILEVRHRHAVDAARDFRMEPGFVNFDRVDRGQLLARERGEEVRARLDGRILLPLYQGQGDDGFFIAREVGAPWLRLSATLRRLRLDRLVRHLPGIRRHPELEEVLVVNTRVARWYPLEIFHLFGYRKLRQVGAAMLVARRRHDLAPPLNVRF